LAFTQEEIITIYKKRAKNFDMTSKFYKLVGFNDEKYRKKTVEYLELSENDTIVEIGCGTGLNFPILLNKIGKDGKIIGLDISVDMLAEAKKKIKIFNWNNVSVHEQNAMEFDYKNVSGVVSTLAFTLIPEYEELIIKISKELPKNKKFVIMDLKLSKNLPFWMMKLLVVFARPFGVTLDLANKKPYESMQKHFDNIKMKEYFFGILYICTAWNE